MTGSIWGGRDLSTDLTMYCTPRAGIFHAREEGWGHLLLKALRLFVCGVSDGAGKVERGHAHGEGMHTERTLHTERCEQGEV